MRIDRIQPRLPLGLRFLQRLDVLRTKLSNEISGGCGGRNLAHSRTGGVSARRRGLYPSRARHANWGTDRKEGYSKKILPRDPWRYFVAEQRSIPVLAEVGTRVHVFRHRGN